MTNPPVSQPLCEDFRKLFADRCPPEASAPAARGRPPSLEATDIVAALAWHVLQPSGTFADNLAMLLGEQLRLADSTLSHRRSSLGQLPWLAALQRVLGPIALPALQPEAFYQGLRLMGIDGTTFNVANTPILKRVRRKTRTRRGKAAFHRLCVAALCELGTHAPVALLVGLQDESEGALARQVAAKLRAEDLLIVDRYYGNGRWVGRLVALPQQPRFLLRVREQLRASVLKVLPDGSKLVEVLDPESGRMIRLRQVKARIRRPGGRWVKVRYWTNLLNCTLYPAKELVQLYAKRWEQEIAYREIKHYLHDDNLLLSHTVVTAAQEIYALFMAQAIVAALRGDVARCHEVPIMQVSFGRTLDTLRNLCWLAAVAGSIISTVQFDQIEALAHQRLAETLSAERRRRSCPRLVRQPIRGWHRLTRNSYLIGTTKCEIRR
jgi:hypothetical protein